MNLDSALLADLDKILSTSRNIVNNSPNLVDALVDVKEAKKDFQDDVIPSVGAAKEVLNAFVQDAETIIAAAQNLLDILDEV
jgi:hypothetical protein